MLPSSSRLDAARWELQHSQVAGAQSHGISLPLWSSSNGLHMSPALKVLPCKPVFQASHAAGRRWKGQRSCTGMESCQSQPVYKLCSTCRMPDASPREPASDGEQTAQLSQDPPSDSAAGQAPISEIREADPETAPGSSVSSWPRSIANADGRPSLFSAFPAAGEPRRVVRPSVSTNML